MPTPNQMLDKTVQHFQRLLDYCQTGTDMFGLPNGPSTLRMGSLQQIVEQQAGQALAAKFILC